MIFYPKYPTKKLRLFYVMSWQALIVFRIIEIRFYAVSNSCYAYFTLCHVRKLLSGIHDILPHPRLENLGYPPPVKLTFDSPDLPVTDSFRRKSTFYTFCAIVGADSQAVQMFMPVRGSGTTDCVISIHARLGNRPYTQCTKVSYVISTKGRNLSL